MSEETEQQQVQDDGVLIYVNNKFPPAAAPAGKMRFRIPVGSSYVGSKGMIRPDGKIFWEPGIAYNRRAPNIFDVIDIPLTMGPHWEWEPMDELAKAAHAAMLKHKAKWEAIHAKSQRRLLPGYRDGDDKDEAAEARAEAAQLQEKVAELTEQLARMQRASSVDEKVTPGRKAG